MKREFDKEIFMEMVLYIAERCQDKPDFGVPHLIRILHYSDFFWYGHTGRAISGETYVREKHGPIPKHFDEVRDDLVRKGILEVVRRPFADYTQERPIIKKKNDLVRLSKEQKEFIDTVIVKVLDHAPAYTNNSPEQGDLSWQHLNNGEEIPYETVFFRRRKPLSQSAIDDALDFIDGYENRLTERTNAT